jgi:membrane protease subunit (stomatin/prohibitin family)
VSERQNGAQSSSSETTDAGAGVDASADSGTEPSGAGLSSEAADSGGDDAVSREATDVDPLDRIEQLADLRDRGIITDAEFEERKSELLDRL